jgi:hypothetical protein
MTPGLRYESAIACRWSGKLRSIAVTAAAAETPVLRMD